MPSPIPSAKEIFLGALDKADLAERANYLRDACGTNADLRRHVEALLRVHDEPDSLLDQERIEARVLIDREDAPSPTIDQPVTEKVGTQIGPYKLLQQIGEGGMGVVYMAEQLEPVKRRVALKIIKPGMDTRQVIARFEAERQALSLMDHPNIANVLDAGTTDSGRPYFVMELVKGQPITQYCDEKHLTPRQRLELLLPVCQAIQHAHQKGIIHRDIKPTNILVAEYDNQPVPKVIDFGVAKATSQTLTEKTMFTGLGQIVGTLEYMSPEQAKVNQLDIDTRSDIYSLGVLMYELLTGSTPFDKERLRSAGWDEMLRIIREEEPSKPSTKLSSSDALPTLSANRGTEPARLTKLVRGELDWIAMKALEKDRNRRYETANGFAADVQRYLADEAVLACPPSLAYRLHKFVRRNKGSVLAVSVVVLALLGGTLGTTWGLIRAIGAEDIAVAESQKKDEALVQVRKEQQQTLAEQARTKAALLESRREAARLAFEQAYGDCMFGEVERGFLAMAHSLQKARLAELPELEESVRLHLAAWCRPLHPWRRVISSGSARALFFGPDGRNIAIATGVDARFWDVVTGEPARPRVEFAVFTSASRGVAFSPDGSTILTGGADGSVHLWQAATGKGVGVPMQHGGAVDAVAFSPDGTLILTGSADKTARLWEAATGKPVGLPLQHATTVSAVAFSPNANTLLTGCLDGTAQFWDTRSGKPLGPPLPRQSKLTIYCAAFSPDGKLVVIGSQDRVAQLWEVATGKVAGPPLMHGHLVFAVAFSPDGKTILTGSEDKTARLWDVTTGKELTSLQHYNGVSAVAFSPNGKLVLTASTDRVQVWEVEHAKQGFLGFRNQEPVVKVTTRFNRNVAFSSDGRKILIVSPDSFSLWDAATGDSLLPPVEHPDLIDAATFSPDGKTILTAVKGKAQLWEASTGRALGLPIEHGAMSLAVAFSPDSHTILTGGGDLCARLWQAATGKCVGPPLQHEGPVQAVAFSPDGTLILTGSADKTARLWNATTGKPAGPPLQHATTVSAVAFSPDGNTVLTASLDGSVQFWEGRSGKALHPPLKPDDALFRLTFSSNGRFLLTTVALRTVRLWDAATGRSLGPPVQGRFSHALDVSPDGKAFLTGGGGGAQLWESRTGKSLGPPLQLHWGGATITNGVFSPDGKSVLTCDQDGNARLWPIAPIAAEPARVILWAEALTGMGLDDKGQPRVLDAATYNQRRQELERLNGPPWP